MFIIKFYRIAAEAMELAGEVKTKAWYEKRLAALLEKFRAKYLNVDGSCKIPTWQLYTNLVQVIEQLKKAMQRGRSSGSSGSMPCRARGHDGGVRDLYPLDNYWYPSFKLIENVKQNDR